MPSNQLILYCHFLLLPLIFSSIRDFSNESVLPIKWPKYWRFSFSISPSREYLGWTSFRIDWLDLLANSYQKLNLLAPSSQTSQSPELLEINICGFSHPVWAMCNGSLSKLTYMYIRPTESESEVAQSCPTLCNPVDCSLPGSSIHWSLQARILEWVAISFSRGSSPPRDQTQVSHIAGRRFNL